MIDSIKSAIRQISCVLCVLWLAYGLSLIWPQMSGLGIRPRTLGGLVGILMCPLLHADLNHILANSVGLALLLLLALSYSRRLTAEAIATTWILCGSLVWVFGRGSYHGSQMVHIGASGVVFGLIGFLAFAGFWRRDWRAVVLTILVLFLYGGTMLSLLRAVPGISWSSHAFGFAAGVLTARVTRNDQR